MNNLSSYFGLIGTILRSFDNEQLVKSYLTLNRPIRHTKIFCKKDKKGLFTLKILPVLIKSVSLKEEKVYFFDWKTKGS